MLRVRLLGHYTVQCEGQWLELPSHPVQLLLAYLVIHAGAAQPREHLAALFWPDSTPDNARSNLRHALWQLRKALGDAGDCVCADDFAITFHPSDDCYADVVELERDPSGLRSEELMAAAAVYDGDLLPGFYEPWVVLERERLEAVFESKMDLLLEQLLAAQRWTAAIGASERWIALGATPEPAYRTLMTAHAQLGHTSHVHTAYERCRTSLAENVGATPSAETETLYHRLLRTAGASPATGDTAIRAPGPDLDSAAPDEAATLRRQLTATQALVEHERQVAKAHHRAAVRSSRLAAGLALGLAAAVGALARRSRR